MPSTKKLSLNPGQTRGKTSYVWKKCTFQTLLNEVAQPAVRLQLSELSWLKISLKSFIKTPSDYIMRISLPNGIRKFWLSSNASENLMALTKSQMEPKMILIHFPATF